MRLTLVHPCIGRRAGQAYMRLWQMEPLPPAAVAGLTPPGIDIRFYDDRMERIPYDEPTDLVGISIETYTAKRAYQIASEYRKRGVPVVMAHLLEAGLIHGDCLTVTGRTVAENLAALVPPGPDGSVVHPLDDPIHAQGGIAVLRGNLAPDGCVIKPSACAPKFLRHTGPALVFDDYPSMKAAIDREDLDVTEDTVLILRNAGPQGGPGMPEWGMLPIPTKLVKQGVRDMVRISDSRMSGTSYGACILHVSPEAYIGGPLALVKTGDMISLDVDRRTIDMNVSDEELAHRRAAPRADWRAVGAARDSRRWATRTGTGGGVLPAA